LGALPPRPALSLVRGATAQGGGLFHGLPVPGGSARLSARDLAILGRYLFGARWKAALARELEVSVRIVKYWASGQRPTSVRRSAIIIALVQRRRETRLAAVQRGYAALVAALDAPPAALSITTEVVPPYPVPRANPLVSGVRTERQSVERLAAQYDKEGFVAIAAALRAGPHLLQAAA
jgi:hypothetical protein